MNIEIGDWIRFRQNGRLVIGLVEYIGPRASWDSTKIYRTQEGEVCAEQVLERRAPEPKP